MAIRETYVKTIATSDEVNGEIKEDRQGQDQRKKKSDKKKSPKIKARTSTSKTPIKDDIAAAKIGKPKNVSTSNNENVESPDNFSSLMSHVVFVLSGFENPFRTELREKAMAMGAQYAPNWNHNCTHLMYDGLFMTFLIVFTFNQFSSSLPIIFYTDVHFPTRQSITRLSV